MSCFDRDEIAGQYFMMITCDYVGKFWYTWQMI